MAWKEAAYVAASGAVVTLLNVYMKDNTEAIVAVEVGKQIPPIEKKIDLIIERQWEHLKGHP